jgi:hypothetical protein
MAVIGKPQEETAMKTKQLMVIVFIALSGGIIGGLLSHQLVSTGHAIAQDEKPPKVLRAEKFELVDDKGKIRADLFYVGDMVNFRIGQTDEAYYLIIQKPSTVVSFISSGNIQNGISLTSTADGVKLVLSESKTAARLEANLVLSGDPSIRLRDINGRSRIIGTTERKDMESSPQLIRP